MREEQSTPEADDAVDVGAEPNFDVDPNDADEIRMTETVHSRNRKRVLIPLALLLILFTALSFMGPPADEKAQQAPEETKLKTP